ncbi:MAG: HDIG domain-containing protein, partial [Malacoplasma sp.]|nr:HDIG domain-containing protein [Malacoplasma sp.]
TTTVALIAVVIILFILLFLYIIWNYFAKKRSAKYKQINLKQKKINKVGKRIDYFSNRSNNEQIKKIVIDPINKNSYSLSEFEKKLNLEKIKLIDKFEKEIKNEIDQKAVYYLINAMEKQVENVVSSRFSFTIKLPDESLKGKIIGKDGRNKRHFEQTTKTDLIIEPNLSAVTISSPNPIRREKAKQTMEKLLETKNIDVTKISIIYEDVEKNFEKICFELGKKTLENKLKIFDVNQNLYSIIGKLNFRTSYSQNVLLHCTECALLAADLAKELGIEETKAKKAAFFHDIGKAIDFEIDNDHVSSGVKLAKQYNLDDYIVNAIESHHNKVLPNTPYAALVKIVDKLSASRPGARFVSNEEYFKRIEELEKICKSFKGVSEAYAIKSGREIDVIVNPDELSDDECRILIKEIKFKLEENEIVNKQPIEITLIRKFVQKTITEGSAFRDK